MMSVVLSELDDSKGNAQLHLNEDISAIETEIAFSTSNYHPEIFTPLFMYESPENVEEDFSQAYFWTKEWRKIESRSDEDIRLGKVRLFNSVDDLITELNS